MPLKDQILAELQRRYPCAVAPTGAWTTIGNQMGVSDEYVRQVAKANGFLHQNKVPPVRRCADCGDPIGKKVMRCEECNRVPLVCDNCGILFAIERRHAFRNTNNEKYSGAHFCGKACCYAWRKGRPNLKNRRPITHGLSGYDRGCRCDVCKEGMRFKSREQKRKRAALLKGDL